MADEESPDGKRFIHNGSTLAELLNEGGSIHLQNMLIIASELTRTKLELRSNHTTNLSADNVRATLASEFWPAIERACCGSVIEETTQWHATSGYSIDSSHSPRVIMLPSPHSTPPGWSTNKLRSILHRASAGKICFVPGVEEYLLLPDKVSNLQQLRTQLAALHDGQSVLSATGHALQQNKAVLGRHMVAT
ncbi:g6725 [Coccomyxa elongata]